MRFQVLPTVLVAVLVGLGVPALSAASTDASASAPALTLASLFTDHAVLQRGQAVPVWGTAAPGAAVAVSFAGQRVSAIADGAGRWQVRLTSLAVSSEPGTLLVESAGATLMRRDVLVGEVWLCSGQSNMTMSVASAARGAEEVAAADHPHLRLFTVAQQPSLTAQDDAHGAWSLCAPATAAGFSATAYYFGRSLLTELNVPIGLIHSSVGGTPAEAWTRLEALQTVPAFGARAQQEIAQYRDQPEAIRRFPSERTAWEERWHVRPPSRAALTTGWEDPATGTADWKSVTLPAQWGQLGFPSGGVFWVRKDIDLPPAAAGHRFTLKLLWISEQYDTAYWNGVEIGHGGDEAPDYYFGQRAYEVPASQVRSGRNVLSVRIVSASARSGMWQWGRKLEVPVSDPASIDDQWLVRQESAFAPLPEAALSDRPHLATIPFRSVPSALYNGMIHPLIPYALRGAIWYQGESNAGRAGEYAHLLSLMIQDWRSRWGEGDFPFLIQQLVNNELPEADANKPSIWAALREAQQQVAESLPGCAISIGIELGSRDTIHPLNKQEVGRRLALVALERTYGRTIESSGPRYAGMSVEGDAIRVRFSHAQGLGSGGGPLRRFAIAGADHRFVWADARLDGDSVVVTNARVHAPCAVRYAWEENPEGCNLVNQAGLPAAPFRSDAW